MGLQRKRITPACAGNSQSTLASIPLCKDHPRVCGEQVPYDCDDPYGIGSPPRVRGTAALHQHSAGVAGITPACAGNRHIWFLFLHRL